MNEIKLSEKFLLSIKEAALYFQIGEKKLRQLVKENPEANFYVMNGNRVMIKRERFEKYLDRVSAV